MAYIPIKKLIEIQKKKNPWVVGACTLDWMTKMKKVKTTDYLTRQSTRMK